MNFPNANLSWLVVLALLLGGCDPEFSSEVGDTDDFDVGTADPSSFVTIGDSLTAGYMDGALFRQGQMNSYGKIIAGQINKIPGESVTFNQPLMPVGATGSMTLNTTSLAPDIRDRLVLVENPAFDPTDPSSRPVVPGTISPTQSTEIIVPLTGPFHNLGVPGAKSFHLSPAAVNYGDPSGVPATPPTANPFFVRFASSATTSVLADAAALAPSLFVLWIGNNDVLLYAIEGGDDDPDAETITPTGTFDAAYGAIVATLDTAGNKGVLVNVPEIAAIPYFTTVPFAALPLTDQVSVDALNAAFTDYNNGLTAAVGASAIPQSEADQRMIAFQLGANRLLIEDDNLTDLSGAPFNMPSIRQATAADYILLPTAQTIGDEIPNPGDPDTPFVYGASAPLVDGDVLTAYEAGLVETARAAYNATIADAADASDDLVLFDAAALLDDLNDGGINYGTGVITSTFATGGGFSLDGVHPTARGYAVIANAIIDLLNANFGASIPRVDPGAYPTVYYQ